MMAFALVLLYILARLCIWVRPPCFKTIASGTLRSTFLLLWSYYLSNCPRGEVMLSSVRQFKDAEDASKSRGRVGKRLERSRRLDQLIKSWAPGSSLALHVRMFLNWRCTVGALEHQSNCWVGAGLRGRKPTAGVNPEIPRCGSSARGRFINPRSRPRHKAADGAACNAWKYQQ